MVDLLNPNSALVRLNEGEALIDITKVLRDELSTRTAKANYVYNYRQLVSKPPARFYDILLTFSMVVFPLFLLPLLRT